MTSMIRITNMKTATRKLFVKKSLTGAALLFTLLLITGCSTPGYVCPMTSQPGGCSSQMQAYKATLHRKATGLSIFTDYTNESKGEGNG
jgi:hypothetical protein